MIFLRLFAVSIVWIIIMLILMLRPSGDSDMPIFFEGFDKMAHCGTFFVLTVLLYWEYGKKHPNDISKWRAISLVVIATVLFAFFTEAAQYYLSPSRAAEWWDIFADVVGIGMGSFAYLILNKEQN